MLQPQRNIIRRTGFTLIEILVVIAIIAILVALLVPAVMQVLRGGPAVQTANDLQQLDIGIQNFKTTMGPAYFPSRIMLCESYHVYSTVPALYTQLATDSVNYLTSLFPHILDADPTTGIVQWDMSKKGLGIDWNGDGVSDNKNYVILEGHQCLVFFLGGIPTGLAEPAPGQAQEVIGARSGPPGCLGFSANPRDPANLADFQQKPVPARKGPFYTFDSNPARLIDMYVITDNSGNAKTKKGFYSYLDIYSFNTGRFNPGPGTGPAGRTNAHAPTPYATPYAYFSNYGSKNGYNKYNPNAVTAPTPLQANTSDCYNLTLTIAGVQHNVQPYFLAGSATTPTRYYNPDSWQIISAGEDGVYGPGSLWTGTNQLGVYGADDQANFTGGGKLIAGINN
jgi:prepilin-type N-terminal cleavage/methylation domain-containing protein